MAFEKTAALNQQENVRLKAELVALSDLLQETRGEVRNFCPQCGLIGVVVRLDGRTESPIEEDGCCRFCGADTCSWDQLVERLRAHGYEVQARKDPPCPT